jgi:hypothetical protein
MTFQTVESVPPTGQHVVMLYTAPPVDLVLTAIEDMQSAGAKVTLVGPQIRGYEAAAAAADGVVLLRHRAAAVPIDPDNRPVRWTLPWASVVARNLARRAAFGPAKRFLGVSTLWWLALKTSRDALHAVDDADVLTALDGGAVYSVWECARRNMHATAINGIRPTLEHLQLAR